MNRQDIPVLFTKKDLRRVLKWFICFEDEGKDCELDRRLFETLKLAYKNTFKESFCEYDDDGD